MIKICVKVDFPNLGYPQNWRSIIVKTATIAFPRNNNRIGHSGDI